MIATTTVVSLKRMVIGPLRRDAFVTTHQAKRNSAFSRFSVVCLDPHRQYGLPASIVYHIAILPATGGESIARAGAAIATTATSPKMASDISGLLVRLVCDSWSGSSWGPVLIIAQDEDHVGLRSTQRLAQSDKNKGGNRECSSWQVLQVGKLSYFG